MNLAIIIAGITWNARRKGRSMAPTDRPYGGRGVEGGEPLPNLMTFTCGAGAHYNIPGSYTHMKLPTICIVLLCWGAAVIYKILS